MVQIVVAEDELWLRSELVEMIEQIGEGFEIVGEAMDGEDAWNMIHELWPAILVTDIRMPRRDGLELIRDIEEAGLPIVSIIVSGYDDFSYAQQAVRYGVSEYLLKPLMKEELKDALHRSLNRMAMFKEMQGYLKQIVSFLEQMHEWDAKKRLAKLTSILNDIRKLQSARPGTRRTILEIFAGKLTELIKGDKMSCELPARPAWDHHDDISRYFQSLLETLTLQTNQSANAEIRAVIRKATDYIESHYMQQLTLVKIAQVANLSPSYFGYLFKQHTNQSFVNYLNGVRIQKAKALLVEDDIKVYEAAEMVGFISLPYFNRVFKALTDMTPNDFRKGMGL
ncbi:response regulator [Paenibacillus chondroitinus]|uniref:Response regulator n=1 Tax=Paenibacillus chondroitinus TaxID=59842 RepID=A0ABU6D7P3_9BACL|nr:MULTISPECIES: response regulator [Paenibacillus]MCY9661689.1 response regulator [Paenibacillus anseongense]MEB4793774.1 response regulator [Paenibacillus chondroitinus]